MMKINGAEIKRTIGTFALSMAIAIIGIAGAGSASAQSPVNQDCSKFAYAGSRICSPPTTTASITSGGGMSLSGGRVDEGGGLTGSGHVTSDNDGGGMLGGGGRTDSDDSDGLLSAVWSWFSRIV